MTCYIGIDTSCYTTSAAACTPDGRVLCAQRKLLPVKAGGRGLRQSEAVFAHIKQLPDVLEGVFSALDGARVAAVCASAKPRDADDSYMPVFLAGLSHAKALSSALRVPMYETSHQRGHVRAAMIGNDCPARFVALHLSGGTTETLLKDGDALALLGGGKDLHAGQLVDRLGVKMGLPFPAGPYMEQLARACQAPAQGLLPVSIQDGWCSFSGAETKALALMDTLSKPSLALEVYDLLARSVLRLLTAACEKAHADFALVSGGVASSLLLREMLARRLEKTKSPLTVCFGRPEYSGDNAVGVALLCAEAAEREHA